MEGILEDVDGFTVFAASALAVAACLAPGPAVAATERVSLDRGWSFSLNGGPAATVDVPHDWSIAFAPEAKNPSGWAGGYYPGGVGVYERTLVLTERDLARELELVFDGVYRDAEVTVNGGAKAKGTFYGFTGFTVPLGRDAVRVGTNVVRVVARNDRQPNCRWYTGSGIYRHVWLVKADRGTRVRDLAVKTSPDGTVVVSGTVGGEVRTQTYAVASPEPWSPENPRLYTFDFHGEKVRTGFRTLAWDSDRGFFLNGRRTVFHGACVHHDHGPLGAASHDAAEVRKVRQLKRAGFNAVRTSHNPVSAAFLDACDEEGLLVLVDVFDGWRSPKNPHDYAQAFDRDFLRDLAWTVRRDRVHPSVVMWAVGNEIIERTSARAVEDAKAAVRLCHELDPGRPVTMAHCTWGGDSEWLAQDELMAVFDIAGYNYRDWYTESDRARCPSRLIVYTETYPKSVIDSWRRLMTTPYAIGGFVWTGIDYLGESTIGRAYYAGAEPDGEHHAVANRGFPWHGAVCGDIDLTGLRRPVSHLRETLWNPEAPTCLAVREPDGWRGEIRRTIWSVWPTRESWNFEGWEGRPVVAEVCSRAPRVRLTLDGETVGESANGPTNAYCVTFTLPYRPGVLTAEGLDADGTPRDRAVLRTAGAPASVRYSRETVGDLTWVVAEVVDAQGTVCPDAAVDVTFEGDVLGTCSADLRDAVPAPSRTRKTFQGRAMAVVRNPR